MRLLQLQDDGGFNLTEYSERIPPYAILSHTWEMDEEVTFKDLMHGTGKNKAGYRKLTFCGKQAANDGLQFFWVDTCCINKSSSAELSEAINSTFRWYQRASKCYVYLSDVPLESFPKGFRICRWFTRGWTLPELLAPNTVEFYSNMGTRLGDRNSLLQQIQEVTRIPAEALQREDLSKFSVQERLSWADGRVTSREEDAAYCLLGIFDIAMPIIYGEGKERAFKRLIKEIREYTIDKDSSGQHFHDRFESEASLSDQNPSSSTNHSQTLSKDALKKDSDHDSDNSDVASTVFSDGGMSVSSATSAGMNPVQTSGIREVSRALLGQEDLEILYTTAVHNLERRKARAHIRGFLKEYGRNLLVEAGQSNIQIQAAKFVQELAGRIADEISFSVTAFDEANPPLDTTMAKKDLEGWLSSLQPQSEMAVPARNMENMFEGVDSDDEFDSSLQFPNIELVRDFLVHSEAFRTLVEAMQSWLKVGSGRKRDVRISKIEMPEKTEETTDPNLQEFGGLADNLTKSKVADDTVQGAAGELQADDVTSESVTKDTRSTEQFNVAEILDQQPQQNVPQEARTSPIALQNHNSVRDLVSGLLDYWGISFFFYDLVEVFVPRVPLGYERLRWRCSCNTVLWGDFPANEEHALNELKRDLAWWNVRSTHHGPSYRTSASPPSGGPGATHLESVDPTVSLSGLSNVQPASPSIQMPQKISNSSGSIAPHVVNIRILPRYFEVCVNIDNNDVGHHEIDISDIDSDGDLFERIWAKYKSNRGILRRLFLRPCDVHFVMFSVNRHTNYGAGIHEKPDEFPPQLELDEKRYHYLCPKIRMPVNTFLHYLHRARWNIWGEHAGNTWLKRLPKKLEESVLAAVQQNTTVQQNDLTDADLAFGWGVHILDGPNHAVLGLLLCIGVAVAFVVSGTVVGLAKTQEQGFGIGNFLLAILASLMAAIYFRLQDR